ncbi:hypothetical protein BC628DRAFT_1418369 [Trametes gibbosa]|nr:hypothetical protein BC628DRAFT_1418369 [Trametes gibbosa]
MSELQMFDVYVGAKQTPFVSALLCMSTLIFVLGILGALNARQTRTTAVGGRASARSSPALPASGGARSPPRTCCGRGR